MDAEPARPSHPVHTGPAVAAFTSAAIGLLVMAVVAVATELNEQAKTIVFDVGKAWIPHAEHIGPYSGKETFLLVGWFASWLILHFTLRGQDLNVRRWFLASVAMIVLATVLVWPPVWHFLEGE